MEVKSLDDFRLAPPGWSYSSQPESYANTLPDDLLEAFLCDVDTDAPTGETKPHPVASLSLSDEDVDRAKASCHPCKDPERHQVVR